MYIEEVSGCKLDMENLNIEDFRSLNAIEKCIQRLSTEAEAQAVVQ